MVLTDRWSSRPACIRFERGVRTMTLVSQMRGTPPKHVVRMRTALPVGPKPPLMSRHWATAGLDVGMRACVLPTGKFPP